MSSDLTGRTIDAIRKIEEAMRDLATGPMDWYLNRASDQLALLFERFCPFKEGDCVRLIKAPRIDADHSPGWMSSRHFLVPGAKGTIQSRDADRRGFIFYIIFDDESWLDDGVAQPVKQKHTYGFREDLLEKIGSDEQT